MSQPTVTDTIASAIAEMSFREPGSAGDGFLCDSSVMRYESFSDASVRAG